jgi:hypothetical protein
MTYNAVHSGELDVGRLFQRTFGVLGRNILTLILLGIVFVGAPDALLQFASGGPRALGGFAGRPPTIDWPLYFGSFLLFFAGIGLYNIAVMRVAMDDAEGKRASPLDGLATIFRFLLPGMAAGALVTVGGILTYMLLIIPGVIFLLTYFVVLPVIVAEKASVFGSFRRSAELTRGRRGSIFGALFLMGLLTGVANIVLGFAIGLAVATVTTAPAVIAIATGLLAGVTTSVSAVFGAVVYQRLVELKSGGANAKLDQVFA